MKNVLIPLAAISFSLVCATSASAACWSDRTGERSGFNFTDPQCTGYMNATTGKAAFGTPATDEKATPPAATPSCRDQNDSKCAGKPAENKGY